MAAAQIAVRDQIDPQIAYQVLTSLGMDVPVQDFYRLYSQAQLAVGMVDPTGELPLDQLPGGEVIQHRSTVSSTGYLYQFVVHAVDTESDQEVDIPYSIRTDTLITPGEGIDAAIVSQTLRAPEYNLKVLGAQLTGISELVPEMGKAA